MTPWESTINRAARFLPMISDSMPTGEYTTRPCLEVGGMEVYAYFDDGTFHVEIYPDYTTEDIPIEVSFAEESDPEVVYRR